MQRIAVNSGPRPSVEWCLPITSYERGDHEPPHPSYTTRARGHHDYAPGRQERPRDRSRHKARQVDRLSRAKS